MNSGCQRQILYIHWSQHITNAEIGLSARTGLPHGLRPKTSFVSIRPHSSAHSGASCARRPSLSSRSVIRSYTWSGLETSPCMVALVLVGQTTFVTTLAWSLPISGDKLYCEAVVERRNGPNYNSHTTTTTTWPF